MDNNSTKITIDLSKELTKDELKNFTEEAEKAGAKTLKDHFMNVTIKKEVA